MAILSGIPVLNCQSIETTLEFYQQLLHFVVVKKRDLNGVPSWVHLMNGDTTLMLQAADQQHSIHTPEQQSNISLYFFVNDLKALHHFIKAKNTFVSDVEVTDYKMQEFSLTDPEGNTITIGMADR